MREAVRMYIWYFFWNSVAYALVISLEKALKYKDGLTDKLVALTVVAMLSIVSLLADRIGTIIIAHTKNMSGLHFVVVLIAILSVSADVFLLKLLTGIIDELCTNSMDRLLLAGLCQIVPIELLRDPK